MQVIGVFLIFSAAILRKAKQVKIILTILRI